MSKKQLDLPKLNKASAFFSSPIVSDSVSQYPITQLQPNQSQPRRYFDSNDLQHLATSIKHCGVLEPILVTAEKQNQRTILAGERRWRAAQLAGLTTVPVYELNLTPEIAQQVALIENLLRRDLNPFEELEGYLVLLAQHLQAMASFQQYRGQTEPTEAVVKLLFAMRNAKGGRRSELPPDLVQAVEQLFHSIGATNWTSFVAHRLSLRKLPLELQEALRTGKLDYTKAIEINRLTIDKLGSAELAKDARLKLLMAVQNEQLSLRELKARVAALLASVAPQGIDQSLTIRSRQLAQRISKKHPACSEAQKRQIATLLNQIEQLLPD